MTPRGRAGKLLIIGESRNIWSWQRYGIKTAPAKPENLTQNMIFDIAALHLRH